MQEKKSSFAALLPIAIFLVIYIGGGILFQDFYAMPAIVVFLIALAVAFLQNRSLKFNEKMHLIAEELSDDNIITMCLIFLLAGAFTGAATAAGGVDSTVNLGLTLLPGGLAVVGIGVPRLPLQPHLPNYHAGVSDQFVVYRAVDFDCTGVWYRPTRRFA